MNSSLSSLQEKLEKQVDEATGCEHSNYRVTAETGENVVLFIMDVDGVKVRKGEALATTSVLNDRVSVTAGTSVAIAVIYKKVSEKVRVLCNNRIQNIVITGNLISSSGLSETVKVWFRDTIGGFVNIDSNQIRYFQVENNLAVEVLGVTNEMDMVLNKDYNVLGLGNQTIDSNLTDTTTRVKVAKIYLLN